MTNYQLGDVVLLSDNLDEDYDAKVVGYISSIVYMLKEGKAVKHYEVKIGEKYLSVVDDDNNDYAYEIIRKVGTILKDKN